MFYAVVEAIFLVGMLSMLVAVLICSEKRSN